MKVLQVFEHVQSVLCDMESFHRIGREAVLNASEEVRRMSNKSRPLVVLTTALSPIFREFAHWSSATPHRFAQWATGTTLPKCTDLFSPGLQMRKRSWGKIG